MKIKLNSTLNGLVFTEVLMETDIEYWNSSDVDVCN